jgi:hypothetical protein
VLMALLILLGLSSPARPIPYAEQEEGPPTLIVEVVDPVWIPLPESEVTVKPARGGSSKSAHSDDKMKFS